MISIIGGLKKRARISVPEKGVRPTSSKKRESIFSILESFAKKKNFNIYLTLSDDNPFATATVILTTK